MGYQFAGFLAKPCVDHPADLPDGVDWRSIDSPYVGIAARIPSLFGTTPSKDDVTSLSQQLGLQSADWIFLVYDCWGGRIDCVYAIGRCSGQTFGPIDVSDLNKVEKAYIEVAGRLNIPETVALDFELFQRGYWGDD